MNASANTLKGRTIVLTRDAAGNARLAAPLRQRGVDIIELPLIEVVADVDKQALADALREFASYEWLLFTSRNGVVHFMDAFLNAFSDIRALGFIRIAVIGNGTAEALAAYYLKPDLVAAEPTADSLAQTLAAEQSLDNLKVLLVTGNRNSDTLLKRLSEERAIVDALQVYATSLRDLSGDPAAARFRTSGADAIIFASASAVQAFGEQAGHLKLDAGAQVPALCSFGKETSERMRAFHIPIAVEAATPGIDGMIKALEGHFAAH